MKILRLLSVIPICRFSAASVAWANMPGGGAGTGPNMTVTDKGRSDLAGDQFMLPASDETSGCPVCALTLSNVATPLANWFCQLTNQFARNSGLPFINIMKLQFGRNGCRLQRP